MHKVFSAAYFGKPMFRFPAEGTPLAPPLIMAQWPCGTSPRLGDSRADLVLSDVASVLVGARVRADVLGSWYVEVS